MCDCLKKSTEELKIHMESEIKKEDSGFVEMVSADYQNRPYCISGNSQCPINLPFETVYKRKRKNGKIEEKKNVVGIYPRFCPFCGEEYKKKEE